MYVTSALLSIAIAILILSILKFHKGIYNPSGIVSINGTRCFLAFLVAVSHTTHFLYTKKNDWKFGSDFKLYFGLDNFYATAGKLGVLTFFMISGYLFYRNLYKENVNYKYLYIKRIKRIIPAYWASFIVILALGYLFLGFQFSMKSLVDIVRWLTFTGTYEVGNIQTSDVNSGVDWTLKLEWLLYLSLFPIHLITKGLSKRKKDISIAISIIILLGVATLLRKFGHIYTDPRPVLGFASGLIAYRISNEINFLKESQVASLLALVSMFISLFSCIYAGYYLIILFFCSVMFFIISSGNDCFGILSRKTIVSLGEISYSFYLFHGIVIFVVSIILNHLNLSGDYGFIISTVFTTLILIISSYVAKLSYIFIEAKFYK